MSYELGIPADIRGKLRFPCRTTSADGRQAKRPQRAPGASLFERSELKDATASVGLEVARQRQP